MQSQLTSLMGDDQSQPALHDNYADVQQSQTHFVVNETRQPSQHLVEEVAVRVDRAFGNMDSMDYVHHGLEDHIA